MILAAVAATLSSGFVLAAVLVAVGVVGFFMWDNYKSHTGGAQPAHITLNVKKVHRKRGRFAALFTSG